MEAYAGTTHRKEAIFLESVLIVCGAGASSTFLASRMRALARTRGLAIEVTAASDSEVRTRLHGTTVLLVGPHLATSFAELESEAALFGVPAVLLPATAFGPTGADDAMALLATLAPTRPEPDQSKESHG
jgi:PTS system cellobiose-specific IIB component